MLRTIRLTKWLVLVPALAMAVHAHDFYILPGVFDLGPATTLQVAFHNGDSFPDSEVAPSLARLKDAQVRFSQGSVSVRDLKTVGKRIVGWVDVPEKAGNLILSAHTAPNFIELAPEKFVEYVKEEGLDSAIQWRKDHGETMKPGRERYSKFAKSILLDGVPNEIYKLALGFPIEIIPEANPYVLRPGAHLPVRVMFHGKPAAGLQIEAAWADQGKGKTTVLGRTDSEGRIRVPLAARGIWRVHTLTMERCVDPAAADWESFWASLTFEIR